MQYDEKKAAERKRNADASAAGRDIGPLPEVVDIDRKLSCLSDLERFCLTYFPGRFPLPFGKDQMKFIADLERVILDGGQEAKSLPRGSGKTTLCETGAIWAFAYGHRRFTVLIGATQGKAESVLDNIRAEVETNELLAEDFPEICYPVVRLEGINNRAPGQILDGKRTRIEWSARSLSFPSIDGSAASGAIVVAESITGAIRGMNRVIDGKKIRPDLVIIDDPQTDESARSPVQNDNRESVISGAILGLAGPGKRIAAIMACTPIRHGDMVDRVLDRERHPEWHGQRSRLLDSLPNNLDLWDQYGEILRDGLRKDPPDRESATRFYVKHREEMDRGGDASWPARFLAGQVSAIQYGMELYLLDRRSFSAEYQCQPITDADGSGGAMPIDGMAVTQRLNRTPRGQVPPECTRLTAGVDVQQEIIYWVVCAWDERFGGHIIDYGTYPEQSRSRFTAADPDIPLSSSFPGMHLEARIYSGLESMANNVINRRWERVGGGDAARIERALVDSGYLTDTVHQWARQSSAAAIVTPSKGQFIGASKTPFSEWRSQPGERYGQGWRLKAAPTSRGRLVIIDVNYWKSFVAERLRSPAGTPGAMFIFGSNSSSHITFSDHLSSETPTRCTKDSRTVDEWALNPGRPENHWFDCLVLASAAASISGLRWSSSGKESHVREKSIDVEQLWNAAKQLPVL